VSPGDLVEVVSDEGRWLARAAANPASDLCARIVTWRRVEVIDGEWFRERVRSAILRRREAGLVEDDTACRLAYGEADGLPGCIVDKYAHVLVVALSTPFADRFRGELLEMLRREMRPASIYQRGDESRAREGLPPASSLLEGGDVPALVPFREGDMTFFADVREGHKTGFYLDQRDSRTRLARYCEGRRVLNAFSYTGSFGVVALRAGAESVLNLDTSSDALRAGDRMAAENGVAAGWESLCGDAFKVLRTFRDEGRTFDLVILDPPRFAQARAHVDRACRGYKDINLLAMRVLAPGGILATFSCTGLVSPHLFRQVVASAAMDSKRDVRLLEKLTQPRDHPILMTFPESEYLKGFILHVE
jgi:23S rRNA (cytosine1962-C5)-methyltransferase